MPHWMIELLMNHDSISLQVSYTISESCEIEQVALVDVHPSSIRSVIPQQFPSSLIRKVVGPFTSNQTIFATELNESMTLESEWIEQSTVEFLLPDNEQLTCDFANGRLREVTLMQKTNKRKRFIKPNMPDFPGLTQSMEFEFVLD